MTIDAAFSADFDARLKADTDVRLERRAVNLLRNVNLARASGETKRIALAEELERRCRAEIARRKASR